jgi:hypothetical protein
MFISQPKGYATVFTFLTSPQPLSILERGFFLLPPIWREAGREVASKSFIH